MKPAPFEYHSPTTLEAVIDLLQRLPDAKLLAGGQSLVPLLNFRLAAPAALVDINRVVGLDAVYERDGGIAIGAGVRQAEVERSPIVHRLCPLLTRALAQVAHPVIRNRGTVVGSLAHADPAAELPAVLLALGGHVLARSTRGERRIEAADLFTGPMETSIDSEEVITEAWVPALAGPAALVEESRRHGDFALCGVARAGDRLALFGVAPTPVLADPADPTRGLRPSADLEASTEFRLHLVEVLVARVLAA